MASPERAEVDVLLQLYQIYDRNREALLWFLHDLAPKDYAAYTAQYAGTSRERVAFTSVCGFFELAGVLVNRKLLSADLFFDVFNPAPYWERARPIVEGMRKARPHIYENFEGLVAKRREWAAKRPAQGRAKARR
ncbi:MAG TPA: hypothetical protein VGT06_08340 [Candidatus Methylomirabilis sp.]|jgi:hypothetical protein|nr:hypothetical protein [Candidatus Methylomirabilis sp.]